MRRTTAAVALAVTVAVASLSGLPAIADVPDNPASEAPLYDGGWAATFSAAGPVTTSFPEGSAIMTTAMTGGADFVVLDDVVIGGAWTISGSASGIMTSTMGTASVANTYHGAGPVEGDAGGLRLGGDLTTIWEMRLGDQVFVDEDPNRLGPFDVDFVHVDCARMIGTWNETFAAAIEEPGAWDATLAGVFEAAFTGDNGDDELVEAIEALLAEGDALVADIVSDIAIDTQGHLTVSPQTRSRVFDLIIRSIELEAQLGQATAETDCPLDDSRAGEFSTLITATVQAVARALLLQDEAMPATDLEFLVEMLLSVGAIGSGAAHQAQAFDIQGLLAARLGELLSDLAVTQGSAVDGSACSTVEPCLPFDADVIQAVRAAQLLGEVVDIHGIPVTPGQLSGFMTVLAP